MMSFNPLRTVRSALPARRPASGRNALRCAGLVAGMCCVVSPMAWAIGPVAMTDTSVEVRSELVPASADSRGGTSGSVSSVPQAAALSGAVRNTVWARRGAAAVGVGVESAMGSVSGLLSAGASGERANLVSPNLLVGVAVNTGPRSSLVLDTPLAYRNTAADTSLNPTEAGREVRLGLVIKPADPLRNLRAGQLFKLELSGKSQLALKPRSGGVAVSYSNRF